jgi:fatty acid desaturase
MKDRHLYSAHFEELRTRVQAKNLHLPTPVYGAINVGACVAAYAAGLVLMPCFPAWAVAVYFAVLSVELGSVSHDLIHNQYFKSTRTNELVSYVTADLLIGLSRSWWRQKHNVAHHSYTNSDIHDTDIRDYDEIFTRNEGKFRFFDRHRRVLFWLVSSLLYFNLILLSYRHVITNRRTGELLMILGNLALYPAFLVMNYGFATAALAFCGTAVLAGVHLSFAFMVNHIGMEIIDGHEVKQYSWLDLQTRTSRNVLGGGVVNHILLGLSKHIEHHLFPMVSRRNVLKVAEVTKDFCAEKGIRYHEVSFFAAIREIARTLKTGETVNG